MMNVLLLGASGLLGHNVLRHLLLQGHNVVALLRRSGALDHSAVPEGLENRLSVRTGGLDDYDALASAADGCDAVVNCAGVTDMSLLRYEDYLAINRDLCGLLVRLLGSSDIGVLVHVSTANTIGFGTAEKCADESAPPQSPFADSFYERSKQEGERILLDAVGNFERTGGGKRIVIVNPGFMVGAYDVKPSSGQLLLAAYRKPVMVVPRGGKSFIHVDAVAQAVVSAIDKGVSGQRYLLTGENLTLSQFYRLQSQVCGYRQYLIVLPDWLLLVAGKCGDMLRLMRIRTQLSTVNVRQLMAREYYSHELAKQHLSLPEIPISKAIADFIAYREKQKTDTVRL